MIYEKEEKIIRIKIPQNFKPNVGFGTKVRVGTLLGKGLYEKVLEKYPILGDAKLLVEDGEFVKPKTQLFKTQTAFNQIIAEADNPGIVRIRDNWLEIVDIVENYEYKSHVVGRVKLIAPDEIVITAQFYRVDLFTAEGKDVQAYIRFLRPSKGDLLSAKDITDITGKLVVIPNSPAKWLLRLIEQQKPLGLIIPSINWATYSYVLEIAKSLPVAILQGFGATNMWSFYKSTFAAIDNTYALFYPSKRKLLIVPKTLHIDKNKIYVFKDTQWGKEYSALRKTQKLLKSANAYEQFFL